MSLLFDDTGGYRLSPAERTCTRCGHILVDEDELGLYYQEPVTQNMGPLWPGGDDTVITFADRVHACGGSPHQLPGAVVKDKREECGCHRECSTQPHACAVPCRWPACLNAAETAELAQDIASDPGLDISPAERNTHG